MRKLILTQVFLLISILSFSQTVLISQYVDACSGTSPKTIELWNPSGVDIDMATTPIVVLKGTNGGTPSADITISTGTLKAGETLVVGNTDTDEGTTCHTYVYEGFTFNGDDALVVTLDGVTTDMFGNAGSDPGTEWVGSGVSTKDQNIQLKTGITTGDVDGWTDPSTRYETVSTSCAMTGFGIPTDGCSAPSAELSANVQSVDLLNYPASVGGPSLEQTITFTGSNLGATNATITAPSDFEISTSANSGYGSALNLTPSSGSISSTIYVRLQSGKSLGSYNDSLSVSHSEITDFKLGLNGQVTTGDDTIKVASYNLLQYNSGNGEGRNESFKAILTDINPDIITFNEIQTGESGFNAVRDSLMTPALSHLSAATFIQSANDMSNALFYDPAKFRFVSNTPILTDLRDISEFTLIHGFSLDTFRVYVVHLKASDNPASRTQRAEEIHALRTITDALPTGSKFIVQGDFNIYDSDEESYDSLLVAKGSGDGEFYDPITLSNTSNWNNAANAVFHTQSTRTRQFGGGASGGLDDRFDLMLHSSELNTAGDVYYRSGSAGVFGNDGNHYDDSINDGANSVVSAALALALHTASDHLPIFGEFVFEGGGQALPVSLTYFTGKKLHDNSVMLTWQTAMELNNSGFEVQRLTDLNGWKTIGFVEGVGNSMDLENYEFVDDELTTDLRYYRLKQKDFDGSFELSKIVSINTLEAYDQFRAYPNPFKDQVTLNFNERNTDEIEVVLYDLAGSPIFSKQLTISDTKVNVNTTELPAGLYFLHVNTGVKTEVVKLIKE